MLERGPEGMTLRDLTTTIFLPCGVNMGEGEMIPPHPLPPIAGRRVVPEVIRARKLALPLTYCGLTERGPCTSSGQHSRASLEYGGYGLFDSEGVSVEES